MAISWFVIIELDDFKGDGCTTLCTGEDDRICPPLVIRAVSCLDQRKKFSALTIALLDHGLVCFLHNTRLLSASELEICMTLTKCSRIARPGISLVADSNCDTQEIIEGNKFLEVGQTSDDHALMQLQLKNFNIFHSHFTESGRTSMDSRIKCHKYWVWNNPELWHFISKNLFGSGHKGSSRCFLQNYNCTEWNMTSIHVVPASIFDLRQH